MAQTKMRFGRLHAALMMLVALVACSPEGGSQEAAETAAPAEAEASAPVATSAGAGSPECLPASEVSGIVGFQVGDPIKQRYGEMVHCGYTDPTSEMMAQVNTMTDAAVQAEEHFNDMRSRVGAMRMAAPAELENIPLGERGQAFAISARSEAAVVASGRLYHAEVIYRDRGKDLDPGAKKQAAITLVRRLMGQ